jgi:hypothetical protein
MARKTYASDVEAYIDAELAAANDDRSRADSGGRQQVSASAYRSILATWGSVFPHEFRFYRGSALLALLPALVIGGARWSGRAPRAGDRDRWVAALGNRRHHWRGCGVGCAGDALARAEYLAAGARSGAGHTAVPSGPEQPGLART